VEIQSPEGNEECIVSVASGKRRSYTVESDVSHCRIHLITDPETWTRAKLICETHLGMNAIDALCVLELYSPRSPPKLTSM
jgi:hypothetical protein